MSAQTVQYTVTVHEEDDGSLWAEIADLPGCFASGHTLDELREAVEEAISLYVTDAPDAGRIANVKEKGERRSMRVDEMRVEVFA
jgi:predicted RNase H-like HicB family nuclease